MRIVFPKQHGAWAMLSIPFLLGVFKGEPVWSHILLFLAWVFLYVSSYPLSLVMKGKKLVITGSGFLFTSSLLFFY